MRTQASLGLLILALAAGGCSARSSVGFVFDSGPLVRADSGPVDGDAGPKMDSAVGRDAEPPKDTGTDKDAKPDAEALPDAGPIDATVGPCELDDDLGSDLGAGLVTGTTVGAPTDTLSCSASSPVRRFDWQAPKDGTFIFSLEGSSYDTVLAVRRTCAATSELACDDDTVGLQSRVDVPLRTSDSVVIVVGGFAGRSGDFSLSIRDAVATSEADLCDNGEDDDLDGQRDCLDSDCRSEPGCTETRCDDGIDDDRDGSIDCRDFDCDGAAACIETECNDSVDNDGDGSTDCRDFDCFEADACTETNCSDGADDDGDGTVDCRDFDCTDDMACTENDCGDSVDNDGDGVTDCADRDCRFACRDCSVDDDLGSAVGMRVYSGTTVGGTNDSVPDCSSFSTAPEKILQWSAPAAGTYTFSLAGSSYDTMLYAMNSCEAAVELACNDDSRAGLRSLITLTVAASEELLLFVDGYGSSSGSFTLSIVRDAPSSEAGLCSDTEDNDLDEDVDCSDSDCAADCR